MRRAETFATTEFRMALLAALLIAVALLVAGTTAYQLVKSSMLRQLEFQLVEEAVLFQRIYETGGVGALVDAVHALEATAIAGQRYAGLFDEAGARLAGNIAVAPDLVLIRSAPIVITQPTGESVLGVGTAIQTSTLIVGRDVSLVSSTLSTLIRALLAAGAFTLIACLLTGWILSRASVNKLRQISTTLERVGQGQTGARTGLGGGTSQIDRIAQQIDGALDRLSALMTTSQNTIRSVAHDLRTPLNRAFLLVQQATAAEGADRNARLAAAEEELQSLNGVFDTVLRISTLESTTDRSGFAPVDLLHVINDVVPLFEEELAALEQKVSVSTSGPVEVTGDAQMLKQLLVNLLANASRHTPPGTQIVIRASRQDEGAVLEVSDDGPGIPEEHRADVLKPFVRLDASRTESGSGLGLALVHAIVLRHGATLSLTDNDPGLRVRVVFGKSA